MTEELYVWTLMRDGPFVLGGNRTYRPHGCYATPTSGPHDLGCEFEGYVITAPDGVTYIAEASSGAFVGPNLDTVRADITEGGIDLMLQQVNKARRDREIAVDLTPEDFWRRMRHAS
jgi:hypothetical protein